jgi:transglycosylase-like protein with SLT domain
LHSVLSIPGLSGLRALVIALVLTTGMAARAATDTDNPSVDGDRSDAADAAPVGLPDGDPVRHSAGIGKAGTLREAASRSREICATLERSASDNDLPFGFFTRLIWQESRFDARSVSHAGARGIAQFMPETAHRVGLANPFDPSQAIQKSAELLRDLKARFGNLGLAAAAYNAGPQRVTSWLAGRNTLPAETQAYVRIVTGLRAGDWIVPLFVASDAAPEAPASCPNLAGLAARELAQVARRRREAARPAAAHSRVAAARTAAVRVAAAHTEAARHGKGQQRASRLVPHPRLVTSSSPGRRAS